MLSYFGSFSYVTRTHHVSEMEIELSGKLIREKEKEDRGCFWCDKDGEKGGKINSVFWVLWLVSLQDNVVGGEEGIFVVSDPAHLDIMQVFDQSSCV